MDPRTARVASTSHRSSPLSSGPLTSVPRNPTSRHKKIEASSSYDWSEFLEDYSLTHLDEEEIEHLVHADEGAVDERN